jgi:thymidylate kinase
LECGDSLAALQNEISLRGKLITFEGVDGSGKTLQLQMVADYLAGRQVDFITTREPGGTALGRRIRDAILDPESSGVEPLAELLLYAADRAQHVRKVIHPSLARGAVVLSDRFFDATTAFQGYGRKFDLELIAHLNELATGGIKPDLTLIFDLEVDDALSRVKHRSHVTNPDRLDSEPREFHESVRKGYLEIAAREPDRIVVIEAGSTPKIVFEQVIATVDRLLAAVPVS